MRKFSLFVLLLITASVHASEMPKIVPSPFPGLKTYQVPQNMGPTSQQVSYDPAITQLLSAWGDEEPRARREDVYEDMQRLMVTQVDRTKHERYLVYFYDGASNDPAFFLFNEKTKQKIGAIGTDYLLLPGNGFIYAIGRTDKFHLEHRKYMIRDEKIVEIQQPFLYVGVESRANVQISLKSVKTGGDIVATIPKGDRLFVVLSDDKHLLIKTSFGLLGWFEVRGNRENPEIEDIYFDGD